ncbi:MAG: protein jag [Ruminococcaceae bacterium]|nr:protein jag [Oscillospiraceae bacterium]
MSYIEVTGKTEDEAIQKALAQLGLDRDDVSVEILERAKSGFLGLGACPAKIRVTYGETEDILADLKPMAPAAKEERKSAKTQQPKAEKKPERKEEKPKQGNKPESKAEKAVEPKQAKPRQEKPKDEKPKVQPAPLQNDGEEVSDEKAQAIRSFLTGLLEHMGVTAEVKVYLPEKGRYKVLLVGDNLGALIGRRGETLDAVQQLTSYSVNRGSGSRVRVQLDAENYRDRREKSLQHLANKVAAKVVKYRHSVTLEPMNAYERHVIHTALQDVPGVTTYSTGVEPSRRVIVAYDREKK